jgi:hypothetical protein
MTKVLYLSQMMGISCCGATLSALRMTNYASGDQCDSVEMAWRQLYDYVARAQSTGGVGLEIRQSAIVKRAGIIGM